MPAFDSLLGAKHGPRCLTAQCLTALQRGLVSGDGQQYGALLVQALREADAAGAGKDPGQRLQDQRHAGVVVAADGLRRRQRRLQQPLRLLVTVAPVSATQ